MNLSENNEPMWPGFCVSQTIVTVAGFLHMLAVRCFFLWMNISILSTFYAEQPFTFNIFCSTITHYIATSCYCSTHSKINPTNFAKPLKGVNMSYDANGRIYFSIIRFGSNRLRIFLEKIEMPSCLLMTMIFFCNFLQIQTLSRFYWKLEQFVRKKLSKLSINSSG